MTEEKLLITISDKIYDVTYWKDYHPGGKLILEQYNNKDATEVFYAFHGQEGFEKLSKMKEVGKSSNGTEVRIEEFRKLRQRLIDEGYFKPSLVINTLKTITTIGLVVLGVIAVYFGHWILGGILVGLGYQQLGWLAHDACHHNLTASRKLNNAMGYFLGNVLQGFSVNWWKDRHNTHHAITNVLDADPDVDNLPLFCWSITDLPRISTSPVGPMAKYIIPYQHYYFIPWTVLLKLIWVIQSFFFLYYPEGQNKSYLKSLNAERITFGIHWIGVFSVMCLAPSLSAALLFLLISEFIGGSCIALIVFMNHYACEHFKKEDGKEADFLTLQLNSTKNINKGVIMDWFSGGLNYQIEHHLFPTMPRHNLTKVKPIIEEFCKKNDLPYLSYSYWDCIVAIESQLAQVAGVYKKLVENNN